MNNNIRLKIVLSSILVIVTMILLGRLFFIMQCSIILDVASAAAIVSSIFYFFISIILPLAVVFAAALYFFLKPLHLALDKLSRQKTITDDLHHKAQHAMMRLPRLIFFISVTSSILGGFALVFKHQLYDLFSVSYALAYLMNAFLFGLLSVFIQNSINSIILTKSRQLLKIHYIHPDNRYKHFTLKAKNLFIAMTLTGYIISFFYLTAFHYYGNEIKYNQALESVLKEEKTINEAEKEYNKYAKAYIKVYFGEKSASKYHFSFAKGNKSLEAKLADFLFIAIISSLFFLLVTFALIFAFSSDFSNQIKNLRANMLDILNGDGDLTKRISIIHFDELGEFVDTINRFMERIRSIFLEVSETTDQVYASSQTLAASMEEASAVSESMVASIQFIDANTSKQIDEVNETGTILSNMVKGLCDISNNVDSQASFVDQTSVSVTEMTNTIQEVNTVTNKANDLANKLVHVADQGGEAAKNSINAIKEIDTYSKQVSEIISVISKIADQTNLLAMNAAIEAAHAGDSGRGFAVVAAEVRKLAESSAKSADEVVVSVKNMINRIHNGVQLVEEAGTAFDKIAGDIHQTSSLISEVSTTMEEQKTGNRKMISSVDSLVHTTNNIKSLSHEERENSQFIQFAMDKLIDNSYEISNSVEEQSRANSEVAIIIENVNEVATKNNMVVDKLQGLIAQFKLEGNDHAEDRSIKNLTLYSSHSIQSELQEELELGA